MMGIGKIWNVRRTPKKEVWQPNIRRGRGAENTPKKNESKDQPPNEQGIKKGKKILSAALRVMASLILTVASLWAGYAAYKHAVTSDYFAVANFQIKGQKRLKESEILEAAGIKKGDNIFRIDCSSAQVKLADHPWILEAKVKRRLPRSLDVDVTERVVEATVLFDVPYLVDDEGVVFKRWTPGDPTPAPVLTGFTRESFIKDNDGVQETIRDAISLARRYSASGLTKKAPLAEVHYELDGSFSLAIGGDPVYVRFGKGPYRKKLRRLTTLLSQLRREGRRPAVIFFDNEIRPDRATVRLKNEDRKDAIKEARIEPAKDNSSNNLQKVMSKI